MRDQPSLVTVVVAHDGPKKFCRDLRCGHDRGIYVTTCSFIFIVIFVTTSISMLRLVPLTCCFNVQLFGRDL